LLHVRTSKGIIQPVYATLDKNHVELATCLIELFGTHVGKTKGEITEKALKFETSEFDYRLVRGLLVGLQRRSIFQVSASVDPVLARRTIFERASKMGLVPTLRMRKQILQEAAVSLGVGYRQLENSFYADLDDQLVLTKFSPIRPSNLLKQYNLSLTQTLLFKSTFMEVKVSDHWREVLRAVKFRGLMFSAESREGVFQITVDGPLSLFKLTKRYGTNLAKVLPTIVRATAWEIQANVVRPGAFGKRILRLKLSSEEVGNLIGSEPWRAGSEPSFDSLVEKRFYRDFAALQSEWKLTREPEPLVAGTEVFLPDFSFERKGITVFMEIAGFWTENYLKRKIQKLGRVKGVDVLIAADEKLACDKLRALEHDVIFYKGRVPLKPILTYLASRAQQITRVEADTLNLQDVHLQSNIVRVQTLAKSLKVSEEALRRKLREDEVNGYQTVGNLLVRNEKLHQLESKIAALGKPTLAEAIKAIETEGIDQPYDVLSALGYEIKWSGLDLNQSTVQKRGLKTE
jgi:predicted nuclease of restriction endonuclease-like RecB superfamily